MAESEEDLKRLLMKVKEESEKVGLKLKLQKTKIMASGPITSWEMGKQWKQCQTLFFGGSKITPPRTAQCQDHSQGPVLPRLCSSPQSPKLWVAKEWVGGP